MHAKQVGDKRISSIPRIDYCLTCKEQLGLSMEPTEKIGPVNHLGVFPNHEVITVNGELYFWEA